MAMRSSAPDVPPEVYRDADSLPFVPTWWRVLEAAVGILVVYCAAGVYPDERKRLHNRLDELYLRASYAGRGQTSSLMQVIGAIAGLAEKLFDAVWGPSLLSVRAVCVSLSISLGNFLIASGRVDHAAVAALIKSRYGGFLSPDFEFIAIRELSYGFILLLLTLLQAASPPWKRTRYPVLVTVLTLVILADLHSVLFGFDLFERIVRHVFGNSNFDKVREWRLEASVFAVSVSLSTAVDVLVVAITRTGLRLLSRGASVVRTVLILAANAAICVPVYYYFFVYKPDADTAMDWIISANVWKRAMPDVLVMCQVDAGVCAAILLVAGALLVNGFVWFVAERALYGLAEARVLDKREWLWGISVLLLTDASTDYIGRVVKLFSR
jgi:hypothetical protein